MMKKIIILCIFSFAFKGAISQTSYFLLLGNWSNPLNWTIGVGVPDSTIDVTMNLSLICTVNSNQGQCKDLNISALSNLLITSTGELTVFGATYVANDQRITNNGILRLKGNYYNDNSLRFEVNGGVELNSTIETNTGFVPQ